MTDAEILDRAIEQAVAEHFPEKSREYRLVGRSFVERELKTPASDFDDGLGVGVDATEIISGLQLASVIICVVRTYLAVRDIVDSRSAGDAEKQQLVDKRLKASGLTDKALSTATAAIQALLSSIKS